MTIARIPPTADPPARAAAPEPARRSAYPLPGADGLRIEERASAPVGGLGTFFALTAAGLIFAAVCGAALSWDGAAYLFRALDNQRPFTPNNRLINWPLHLPVVLASRLTSDLPFLQLVFGLTYAAVPLLVLWASWWIVRERARPLLLWAALGIGLGMLPGTLSFVSEANLAVLFAWPIILAILVGLQRRHLPLVALLVVCLVNTHPSAIGFLALATVVAVAAGLRDRQQRGWLWGWAAAFGVLTVGSAVGFFLFRSDYERQQSSLAELWGSFGLAVAGLPLLALACTWGAAALLLLAPQIGAGHGRWHRVPALPLALLGIGGATILFIVWARDPALWRLAALFNRWTAIVALTFLLPAIIEGLLPATPRGHLARAWPQRVRVMQVIAAASSLVLIVQSGAWLNLNSRLRDTLDRSPWPCVSAAPVQWLAGTPLDHWTLAQRSILLQGQAPARVILTDDLCGKLSFERGIPLDPFLGESIVRVWNGGWFDLRAVQQGIAAERQGQPGCSYALTTGWHRTETNDPFWWRWSDGRDAQIRVVLDRDATVTLGGQIESARAPNQIAIVVNGQPQGTIELSATGLRPLATQPLALRAGENVIQLTSQNPPIPATPDGRPLGLSIANLTMTLGEGGRACAFHP